MDHRSAGSRERRSCPDHRAPRRSVMTSASAVPPTPDQMADFYNGLGPLLRMAWGDNFHFGYWDGPSDTSSVEEATDRFTDLLIEGLAVGPAGRGVGGGG